MASTHPPHSDLLPLRLVQITDCHLGRQPGEQLMGMDTDASLAHVLTLIREEQGQFDALLATGDLSNGGSVASFERFEQATESLCQRRLWLPGNHDEPAAMAEALGYQPLRQLALGNWLILMLDSTARGRVGGGFNQQELDWLQQQLDNSDAEHVLLCLHHQPVAIGCDWLDQQMVDNADDFFAIVDANPAVKAVCWGHIHQQIDRQRGPLKLMATPSTCIQFAANSPSFKLDRQSPGYRWFTLHADGRIDSEVSRVNGVEFELDYNNSEGY